MDTEFVDYNGTKVVVGWPEQIEASQNIKAYSIGGMQYPRVPYGSEAMDWGADEGPCGDCAVVKGQFHVVDCDVERCPKCSGQAIWCDCVRDDATA